MASDSAISQMLSLSSPTLPLLSSRRRQKPTRPVRRRTAPQCADFRVPPSYGLNLDVVVFNDALKTLGPTFIKRILPTSLELLDWLLVTICLQSLYLRIPGIPLIYIVLFAIVPPPLTKNSTSRWPDSTASSAIPSSKDADADDSYPKGDLENRIFDMLTAAELKQPLLLPPIPQERPGVRCLGRQCTRNLVVFLVSGAAAFSAVLLQTAVLGFVPPRSSSALDEGFHRYSPFWLRAGRRLLSSRRSHGCTALTTERLALRRMSVLSLRRHLESAQTYDGITDVEVLVYMITVCFSWNALSALLPRVPGTLIMCSLLYGISDGVADAPSITPTLSFLRMQRSLFDSIHWNLFEVFSRYDDAGVQTIIDMRLCFLAEASMNALAMIRKVNVLIKVPTLTVREMSTFMRTPKISVIMQLSHPLLSPTGVIYFWTTHSPLRSVSRREEHVEEARGRGAR
ncbi:hypothetical protein BDZ89DRAFT_1148986 [Hymenopellis radicata]|nr:hypothetical protein BDZ89DRAFT_1148986 [Hymenopellis radicata]